MQITKVHLTKVYASDKDKNGNPLVSKTGKPYTKLAIKCVEHGDKWLSGFQNSTNKGWAEGNEVDIIVKPNGEYLNFDTPKAEDMLSARVSALEVEVLALRNALAGTSKAVQATPTTTPASKQVTDEFDYGVPEF